MADPLHHYIPRWYLRRFANARGQVRVYIPGQASSPRITSVDKVAAQRGFYRADVVTGDPNAIESLLSRHEGLAREAVQGLLKGGVFQPGLPERQAIADFLGLQLFRTPEDRRLVEMNTDALLKITLGGASRKVVESTFEDAGIEPTEEDIDYMVDVLARPDEYEVRPNANEHLRQMLRLSEDAARRLEGRTWRLGIAEEPVLFTSDYPLVSFTPVARRGGWIGKGLDVADMFFFPLDTRHLLMLADPSLRLSEGVGDMSDSLVDLANAAQTGYCYRYVFQHPDGKPVGSLIPKQPRVHDPAEVREFIETYLEENPIAVPLDEKPSPDSSVTLE